MWDLSSLTRVPDPVPCLEAESQPLKFLAEDSVLPLSFGTPMTKMLTMLLSRSAFQRVPQLYFQHIYFFCNFAN